jgi:hypothetical protein
MLLLSQQHKQFRQTMPYRRKFYLHKIIITLPLDFKQHGIHLIDKDHGSQNLSKIDGIILYFFVQQITI